ncbi:MAG: hypothetical protein WAO58_11420 [Fimbriimonadaceae bacterium]
MKRCVARLSMFASLAIGLAGASVAQSFNIDADNEFAPPELGGGVPDDSFGAAANQKATG